MGCGSSSSQKKYDYSSFPTPDMLAYAQHKYQLREQEQKSKKQDTSTKPCPPSTNKAQVYRAGDFAALDKRAKTTPLERACWDFDRLVSYLIEPAKNEIGKARAIFVWISSQKLQQIVDYMGDSLPPEESPLYMILHILVKQWGNGYSEIFAKMCKSANVQCKIIKGKVKGNNYKIGKPIEGTNDYCLIYVEKNWRIVDPHWGSQYVVSKIDDINGDISNKHQSKKAAAEVEESVEVREISDDFYFITDPEAIVYTHMACEPLNQLLARPVKEEEYLEMALLKDAFFEFGMTTVSHPKCYYEVKNGQITFEFGLARKRQMTYCYSLYKSSFDVKANEVNGVGLEQFVLLEYHKRYLSAKIYFPKIGKYTFELYGKDGMHHKDYKVICEYLINCLEPDLKFEPLPENSRSEWGANSETEELGLEPINVDGGIIRTKDGKASFGLQKTQSEDIIFSPLLINPYNKRERLENCIRHYCKNKTEYFFIKCPSQGDYILEMRCKSKRGISYENVCNYLVKADQGCPDLAFYPESDHSHGQTGNISHPNDEVALQPSSHLDAIIDPLTNKNEMLIEMVNAKKVSNISAKLTRHIYNENETEDCSQYVYLYQEDSKVRCHLNFPRTGFYKLDFKQNDRNIYEYLLNVPNPDIECSPYPKITKNWRSNYQIIEPKSYYLTAGTKVDFKVELSNSVDVFVEEKSFKQKLTKQNNKNLWEGEVSVPKDVDNLQLKHSTGNGNAVHLLSYRVLDNDEKKILKEQLAAEEEKSKELLEQIEKNKMAEKHLMEVHNEENEIQYKKAKKEFTENKKKFEEEEKALQLREIEYEEKENYEQTSGRIKTQPTTGPMSHSAEEKKIRQTGYRPDEGDDWRKFHPKLTSNLALEKLRECIRQKEKTLLKSSIDECVDNGLQHHKEVRNATFKLQVLEARKRLEEACLNRDPTAIIKELRYIETNRLNRNLYSESREAENLVASLTKHSVQTNIFNLDKKTMTEIRRYTSPPQMFHHVMQSTFLLLGEDEDLTDSWKECQKLCNPQGSNGLNKKILTFDVFKVHPEMVARADQMLKDVDVTKVQTVCPGAVTFYVWSKGVIDEYQSLYDLSQYKPASRERQREILGRIEEPFKYRRDF